MEQNFLRGERAFSKLQKILQQAGCKKVFLICGNSFDRLPVAEKVRNALPSCVRFSGFGPNPRYENICEAVRMFCDMNCDGILAVGGGSAMDVAKCVKLFCRMDQREDFLTQKYRDNGIPLIVLPTTAGTGSESTHFAVLYRNGQKLSAADRGILPGYVMLIPEVLASLPLYQKKCTLLDALCQGIESWWSVNSTEESISYARKAVETILQQQEAYLNAGGREECRVIQEAANLAGRAINLTKTSAPHAMSYKLTSLYGLPHGHAVALCLPEVWEYMLCHLEHCVDPRGSRYLRQIFSDMEKSTGGIQRFRGLLLELGMGPPEAVSDADLQILAASVNSERLKNNPVLLDGEALYGLYKKALGGNG